jgi:hypothetical protein
MKMTIESTAAKRGRLTKNLEKFMGGAFCGRGRGGGKEGAWAGSRTGFWGVRTL